MHKYLLAGLCSLALVCGEFTAYIALPRTSETREVGSVAEQYAKEGGSQESQTDESAAATPEAQLSAGRVPFNDVDAPRVSEKTAGAASDTVGDLSKKGAKKARKSYRWPVYDVRVVRGQRNNGGPAGRSATTSGERAGEGVTESTVKHAKKSGRLLGRTVKKLGGFFNQ